MKRNGSGWPTHFEVFAFSPDGPFSCEELEKYLNRGIQEICREEGIGFRHSPIKVTVIKEVTETEGPSDV